MSVLVSAYIYDGCVDRSDRVRARTDPAPWPQSARLDTLQLYSDDSRAGCALPAKPRNAARASRYMPTIIKRIRNFGYRVPYLRRRFQLEDLLLVGVAVGGSFAVVLGWILWVHWRIL